MGPAGLLIFAVSLTAAGEKVPAQPVSVTMVAVEARREGRAQQYFGPGLDPVRRALASLDFDTFNRVQSAEIPAPYGEEQTIHINQKYTLHITPVSQMEDGRVRLRARITARSRDGSQTINALDTTLQIKPGIQLNLGGLRLESGELILVISVK
jgi:hypothetical protein